MKVLITGIAGFVGSHLVEKLLKKKDEVFGTYLPGESLENIQNIRLSLHLSGCDITQFDQLSRLVKRIQPDLIYHLAAFSSVGKSFTHPLETIKTNVYGTLYLLEIVRSLKKQIKILVVGSSDMYGKVLPRDIPITENTPLSPVSPYGVSKATCDLLAYQYCKSYGVYVIRARSFNHTGPRQRTGFVIPDFASQIAQIEAGLLPPVLKVGNLSAKRDLSDVRDVVRAYVKLMQRGKAGEAYNICSQQGYSIKNMLKVLLSLSKKKITVKLDKKRSRPSEIPVLVGDNTKIRKTVGWKPEIPLERTLKETLDYWRKRYKVF